MLKQPLEVFYEKGVPRNFTKFTGKHLCQSLFFNKVAGLRHLRAIASVYVSAELFWRDSVQHSFN